jgi:hypothetical protein
MMRNGINSRFRNTISIEEFVALNDFTEEEGLEHIRNYNLTLGLPPQEPGEVLYNRALFETPTLQDNLFLAPLYNFTHPLSDYPEDEQYRLLNEYARNLGRINHPRTFTLQIEDRKRFIRIVTHEINKDGYWTFVQRTVFLHDPLPCYSTDIIVCSIVGAPTGHNNRIRAPTGINYPHPE